MILEEVLLVPLLHLILTSFLVVTGSRIEQSFSRTVGTASLGWVRAGVFGVAADGPDEMNWTLMALV